MRKEASIEKWKKLYEVTTRIKELAPWEYLWDLDLIGIQNGAEEDTIFYSILGRGGECYGITIYEGYEGLNNFLMLTMQKQLNLSTEYVMFNQKNLTCYWGNREELTDKQRKIIKDIGYKCRGKNQWLYFMSFEPGYFPYNLDENQVERMTEYLENLEIALQYYTKQNVSVDFEAGNMFSFVFKDNKKEWDFGEKPLPFFAFQFGNLIITDDELIEELSKAKRCNQILEVDSFPMGVSVADKKFERPANPNMSLIADAKTEMILRCEMQEPGEDVIAALASEIIGFIFNVGAPKEIRVSNIIIEAGLEQICDICKIKLRRVKTLNAINYFKMGMREYL